ncbi:MAG TPA: hypothetical protein VF975_00840 [Thermoanaerobaculia bacterium]
MSRGFLCTMVGIAMTLFSWFSPWAWPAWPALTTMRILVGTQTSFADLPYAARGAMIVLLIAINVAFWAAVARLLSRIVQGLLARRRPAGTP